METYAQSLDGSTWYKVLTDGGMFAVSGVSNGIDMHVSASDTTPSGSDVFHSIPREFLNGFNTFTGYPAGAKVWIRASGGNAQSAIITRTLQA